jgi:adenosylmethionine-8-amino-7-oxononanoate aminotransferase
MSIANVLKLAGAVVGLAVVGCIVNKAISDKKEKEKRNALCGELICTAASVRANAALANYTLNEEEQIILERAGRVALAQEESSAAVNELLDEVRAIGRRFKSYVTL